MTIGYLITDLDSLCSLATGSVLAKRFCALLNKLSKLKGTECQRRNLKNLLNGVAVVLYTCTLIVSLCYIYVAVLRMSKKVNYEKGLHCILLGDQLGSITQSFISERHFTYLQFTSNVFNFLIRNCFESV